MTLQEYNGKEMQISGFKKTYGDAQPQMNIIRAITNARISRGLSQKELSEKTGIDQSEISRLENGNRNPTIKLLQRIADGMDMTLDISFRPKSVM
ncbi:MAG: XRE family transcriptional regulator [Lachnospiraceae bacterium]|uniref:Helix-turn-helix transcriptional regulator n=1 Tax=Candidatus Weimeria bifida TaxID=2599074 RepID=A0A6N7J1A9_9FIRM|nr:helix-turn-helix transcriptional regulator [Candidatus Weimeria bifida]RRF97316.1 MAG: XRE family transcriptional regulator [Lachnospiraceae bacterium]